MKKMLNWYALFVFMLIVMFLILFVLPKAWSAEEMTSASLMPPVAAENAIKNADYLFEGIIERTDIKNLFADINSARQSLLRRLKALPHIDYELPCRLSAKPESVLKLSLPQLIRVFLFLDGLENSDLTKQFGQIIASYEKDSQYEPGGIGLIKKGQLIAEQITSDSFVKPPNILAGYSLPKKDLARPHVFTFHLHPRLLNIFFPSPSWITEFAEGLEANIKYDIGEALARARLNGDSHQLLISELPNRTFNLAYYSAEKVEPPANPDPFGFCYRLTGFKIVNLGIWNY